MSSVYRYKTAGVAVSTAQNFVPPGVNVKAVSQTPLGYVDVTVDVPLVDQSDLDDAMRALGFLPVQIGPVTSPSIPTKYQTCLDIDFSALPNQVLSPDGLYTVGGVANVKKENSANDAVAMQIVTGAGLQIKPNGGQYFGANRTQPLLWFPFASFFPAVDWGQRARLLIELASDNGGVGDYTIATIDNDSMLFAFAMLRGVDGGGNRVLLADATVNTGTTQYARAIQLGGSVPQSGVFALETSPSLEGGFRWSSVGYAAGPPMPDVGNFGSMTPVAQVECGGLNDGGKLVPVTGGAGSNLGVSIGASNANPGYTVVVKRLRVDVG